MSNLLRCFGFTENRLHLGQKQCKSKAETKLVLAMLRRSLRSLTQTVPVWFGSRFALFFESRTQSRTSVRSFVLALSTLHLTHSDTPPEIYSNPYLDTPSSYRKDLLQFTRTAMCKAR